MAVLVRVAGQAGPRMQDDGDVEDDEHEQVAVVEPEEVVEHLFAEPRVLQRATTKGLWVRLGVNIAELRLQIMHGQG